MNIHPSLRLTWLLFAFLWITGCQSAPPKPGLSEAQVAMLKAKGFKWTDEGWAFGLSGKVLFDNNSERISETSRQTIADITHALLKVGITGVILEGHTDNYGTPDYNRQLSERRAGSVGAVMEENGMQKQAIQLRGLGQTRPIADNATAAGRRENRRVVIIVVAD